MPAIGAFDRRLFVLDVLAQSPRHRLQRLAFKLALGLAQQADLDGTARCKSVTRLFDRRFDHIPALACSHLYEAARLQLHQRLAHQGSADAEQVGQRLLAESLAGGELLREDRFDDPLGDFNLADHGGWGL